ncbi:hypothetical protein PPSIR1_10145 [Plesiocystis pacifica SIR-1]|uniref:YbbR-like protein n=1 Tax=Plesiocystis pacifica SIR-1 TaxID=391625 RepID=A6GKI3_9BACT|nr:CdaR family protein [Plesiocystis pacifica]EDM73622.1 hypothetical protein PPSIR1_10145 [Plesiocystis pacifica SIR-1]
MDAEGNALTRVGAALTRNWGTKLIAFFLTSVVFVVTRGEVQRSFTVPLEPVADPNRVLLTDLPETVEVSVHGPWANVNRLDAEALGAIPFDLTDARPGPMVLDPAAVVMPPGVVLEELDYDAVDLRFDAIVERLVPVLVELEGKVGRDYELRPTALEPEALMVRGARSRFEGLGELDAGKVDISGLTGRLERELDVPAPGPGLRFVGAEVGEGSSVRLIVEATPTRGELALEVAVEELLLSAIDDAEGLPRTERLTIRGPRAALRRIAALEAPLVAQVGLEGQPRRRSDARTVTLTFGWSAGVSEADREILSYEPEVVRLRISSAGVETETPKGAEEDAEAGSEPGLAPGGD